jgi:hypothetical protein
LKSYYSILEEKRKSKFRKSSGKERVFPTKESEYQKESHNSFTSIPEKTETNLLKPVSEEISLHGFEVDSVADEDTKTPNFPPKSQYQNKFSSPKERISQRIMSENINNKNKFNK